jgi:hypothetical protein
MHRLRRRLPVTRYRTPQTLRANRIFLLLMAVCFLCFLIALCGRGGR